MRSIYTVAVIFLSTSAIADKPDYHKWYYDPDTGHAVLGVEKSDFQEACEAPVIVNADGNKVQVYQYETLQGPLKISTPDQSGPDCAVQEVVQCWQKVGSDGQPFAQESRFQVNPFEEKKANGGFRNLTAPQRMLIVPMSWLEATRKELAGCVRPAWKLEAKDSSALVSYDVVSKRVTSDYKKMLAFYNSVMKQYQGKSEANHKKDKEKKPEETEYATNTTTEEIEVNGGNPEEELAALLYSQRTHGAAFENILGGTFTEKERAFLRKQFKSRGLDKLPTQFMPLINKEKETLLGTAKSAVWDGGGEFIVKLISAPIRMLSDYMYSGKSVARINEDWVGKPLIEIAQGVTMLATIGYEMSPLGNISFYATKNKMPQDKLIEMWTDWLALLHFEAIRNDGGKEYQEQRHQVDLSIDLLNQKFSSDKEFAGRKAISLELAKYALKKWDQTSGLSNEERLRLGVYTGVFMFTFVLTNFPFEGAAAIKLLASEMKLIPTLSRSFVVELVNVQKTIVSTSKIAGEIPISLTRSPKNFADVLDIFRTAVEFAGQGVIEKKLVENMILQMDSLFEYVAKSVNFDLLARAKVLARTDKAFAEALAKYDHNSIEFVEFLLSESGNSMKQTLSGPFLLSDADFTAAVSLLVRMMKESGKTYGWSEGTAKLLLARVRLMEAMKGVPIKDMGKASKNPEALIALIEKQASKSSGSGTEVALQSTYPVEYGILNSQMDDISIVAARLEDVHLTKDGAPVAPKDSPVVKKGKDSGPDMKTKDPVGSEVVEYKVLEGEPEARLVATEFENQVAAVKKAGGSVQKMKDKVKQLVESFKKKLPQKFQAALVKKKGSPKAVEEFDKTYTDCVLLKFGMASYRSPASESGKKFATRATCSASSDAI